MVWDKALITEAIDKNTETASLVPDFQADFWVGQIAKVRTIRKSTLSITYR